MEKKQALRRYAKRRHGAYPEVDKFILVDTSAKREVRYLVDGEMFASNLTEARTMMAERLKLSDPKLVDASMTYYTPATGWKQPNHGRYKSKPTDEGNTMNDTKETIQTPEGEQKQNALANMLAAGSQGVQPSGNWLKAQVKLDEWERVNPEPSKDDKKAYIAWTQKRGHLRRGVSQAKNHILGLGGKPGRPVGSKSKPKENTMKKDTVKPLDTSRLPATYHQQGPIDHKPMMIETGAVKITVHGAEQMDMAIASLKKHSVI